ncbi:MAG TPA: MmcQ/YjbR family DNA-binding protein [Gemmata sp.]
MPNSEPFAAEEAALRDLAMRFPGATEEFPWGHRAIKVKGKIFVTIVTASGALTVSAKLPDSNTYALTQPYAEPTGYGLGKHGWVTCTFGAGAAVPMDLLEEWIEESYRAVAPKKLVLARNAQLGGAEPPLVPPPLLAPAPAPTPKPTKKAPAKKNAPRPRKKK